MNGTMATTGTNNAVELAKAAGRGALRLAWYGSVAASAYHGYKRNDSVGWAVGWGILGGLFPIITPAVALAQGFGQRKRRR